MPSSSSVPVRSELISSMIPKISGASSRVSTILVPSRNACCTPKGATTQPTSRPSFDDRRGRRSPRARV